MSPYSNGNYLSSTVGIVIIDCGVELTSTPITTVVWK